MSSGVIAAGDKLTAEAGTRMLREGGNAVDAAVAAAFTSFISEIGMVHTGGSGLAQLYLPEEKRSVVYDFFSNMPGIGKKEINSDALDFQCATVDFGATTQDFYIGRGSVAVPGNLYGLCQMVEEHGQLPLKQVLQPAIELARNGRVMNQYQASTCRLLQALYTHSSSMRDVFQKENGELIDEGDVLIIPHLAETLENLANEGISYLVDGDLGKRIVADQKSGGGLVNHDDLIAYNVLTHTPIRIPYRDHEILLPRPCSSGGVLTAFTFKLLARFDVPRFKLHSSDHLQLLFEVQAATTRARHHWELAREHLPIGDAVYRFLNDEFVSDFATEVMYALMKGRPSRVVDEKPTHSSTSHLSVIDKDGMAVSITTTAGESAGYVVPETGFIMNNMLGEEDLHPQGFHAMPPGKRIYTMMTPAVVLKDGKVRLVTGSGGSLRIRSAVMQVISNAVDFDLPLQEAIDLPRYHLENKVLQCEYGHNTVAVDELESLGYPVNRWQSPSMYFGGAHSVAVEKGRPTGAGDGRRSGSVDTIS